MNRTDDAAITNGADLDILEETAIALAQSAIENARIKAS
jgi:hypothetical protein